MRLLNDFLRPIRYYTDTTMDLLFPSCCAGCRNPLVNHEKWLCTVCLYSLPETRMHMDSQNEALRLVGGQIPARYVLCYLYFNEASIVQQIVHHFKYLGMKELGQFLGQRYAETLLKDQHPIREADVLIPVPIQASRLRKRGYNQSLYFANGLGEKLKLEVWPEAMRKVKNARSQVGKGRMGRFENLERNVVVNPEYSTILAGKHVVIVDDVLTTGATVIGCAQELEKAGAAHISIVALARKRN